MTVKREKSSMKVMKYLALPRLAFRMGPQRSECTSSNTFVARRAPDFGNGRRTCFPSMHPTQRESGEAPNGGSPITMPFFSRSWRLSYPRWPNRSCHNRASVSTVERYANSSEDMGDAHNLYK